MVVRCYFQRFSIFCLRRGKTLRGQFGEKHLGRNSEHPGIVIKQSYWREPDTGRAGNTIDFFVAVLGMTFHQAMEAVTR